MFNELRKLMVAGFVFGILFSLFAYVAKFQFYQGGLLMIPFATAILCVLGAMVGAMTTSILEDKTNLTSRFIHILSFVAAAAVNVTIILITLSYYGIAVVQQEMLFGTVLGLSAGGIYGLYVFTVERLKERMLFLETLADNNRRLQEASRRLTLVEERNRLGRELHDSVSQGLHALVYSIHSLRNVHDPAPEPVLAILDHMESTANWTLEELRSMIEELRPSLLSEHGLEEALRITIDLFAQRQRVPVELTFSVHSALTPEMELAIYRVVQEALTNIERHAAARHVLVKLQNDPVSDSPHVLLTIKDDGCGFDSRIKKDGNGLRNMRQRVEEVGGRFNIVSKSNLGTTITAKFQTKG